MSAINILIYAGSGVSRQAVRHTQHTLKALLGHAYDVTSIDAATLGKEPWEESCAMLVMTGSRDIDYNDLTDPLTMRIRQYVHDGGRYLGFCAGAYYGSKTATFEQARNLQDGSLRELGFFPGAYRRTAHPGFVSGSESTTHSVSIALDKEKLQPFYPGDIPHTISMNYNGGGYFVNAASHTGVDVLARFTEPGICTDEAQPAAVVQCRVGNGTAGLMACHPEYPHSQAKDIDHGLNATAAQISKGSEHDHKAFLRAVFARMGLNVVGYERDTIKENKVPSLTPIYLSAIRPDIARTIATNLRNEATEAIIQDAGNHFVLSDLDTEKPLQDQLATLSLGNNTDETNPTLKLVLPTGDESPCIPPRSYTPYFSLKAYYEALSKHRSKSQDNGKELTFGNAMLYTEVLTSTQTVLDKNFTFAQALPQGLVCHATNQIAARGRGRNTWVSQFGALQFSFIVRHSLKLTRSPVVFIQYLIAMAVVESIRSREGYKDVPLRLKWPNDIYAEVSNGKELKKVTGLLVNSSFAQDEFLLVIGVGLDLSNMYPTVSVNDVIQAHNPALPRLTAEDTLAGILVTFEKLYNQFCAEGMGPWFLDKYYALWLHSDKIVTLTTHDNERVRITGITSDYGMLSAVSINDPTKHYTLQPDGNSFDMLKGLIKKKT